VRTSKRLTAGILIALALGASLLLAAPSLAALPRAYDVQRVDSPNPTVGGDFGIALVSVGDLNGDAEDDILVGTDEHGGSVGQVFVISGADGAPIRTINAPDPGGTGTLPSFGSYVGKISDIGSCVGGTPGATCPLATIGAGDGVPDLLVTALGVDVGTLVDAGRAYLLDGATGAVLKRLDMPAADLTEQQNAPGGPKKPAFGRTILSPSSQYGPTNPANTGPLPASPAVQLGDMNGGGEPDIIVSASDYFETGATANPESPCADNPANECLQAGRSYVYYGETIASSDPAVIDDTPDMVIKNPAAQPDDLTTPVNSNRENLGYSITTVGDLGRCNTNPGPGMFCTNANSTGTDPDARPDVVISSHRTDDFDMFDVGVAHLIDGSSGAVLYTYRHPEPQPASLFAFTNYNQPAFGDLGSSTTPDVYEPAMRQNNPFTGGGRGYVMNGAFKQGGSPNSISFGTLNDPTPHPSEDFGTSSAGIGNVVGFEGGLDGRNELLIGAYGPHNPGTNPFVINDVHIFSALTEQPLQTIPAPDQQAGSGFGTALAPLGDLNEDGFLDFAVGAGLYDGTTGADQGRIYILRSNNTAPVTPPAGGGGGGAPTPGGTTTIVVPAGRTLELDASRSRIRRGRRVRLIGLLEAFANPAACERFQTVALQRRRPGRRHYRTFKRVTTNSQGEFGRRIKPRRTYIYRARVGQTSTCLGAASERIRVRVLRRSRR
jgi:FG-GAP repeat